MNNKKISKFEKEIKNMSEPEKEFFINSIGYRVRKLRLEHGFSQLDLAKKAGAASYQNIQNVEKNIVKIPLFIDGLAKALGASIDYLITGEENPKNVNQISFFSVDSLIKHDLDSDYHLVKIKKDELLFVPQGVEILGKVDNVFIGHTN
jgi:transcriptional regulator with XRE-family HTH domain